MIYDRSVLVLVLINHQRKDIGHCSCGWDKLGASHAEHVANVYERTVTALGVIQRAAGK